MGNSVGGRVGEGQEGGDVPEAIGAFVEQPNEWLWTRLACRKTPVLYLGTFADIVLVDHNRLGVEGFSDDCGATLPRWRSGGWTQAQGGASAQKFLRKKSQTKQINGQKVQLAGSSKKD